MRHRRELRVDGPGETLEDVAAALSRCRICAEGPFEARLPHEPNPIYQVSTTARLCIASQAAGTRAHASSLPFDDASGDRLRAWLDLGRQDFYDAERVAIVPMGFCFPGQDAAGGDLPPRRECAPAWRARLFATLPQIELILAIGQYAQAWHLGAERRANLTATVVAWREIHGSARQPRIIPLPHPSWRNSGWLKRNPWFEAELLPAVRSEVRRLVNDTPPTQTRSDLRALSPAVQNR